MRNHHKLRMTQETGLQNLTSALGTSIRTLTNYASRTKCIGLLLLFFAQRDLCLRLKHLATKQLVEERKGKTIKNNCNNNNSNNKRKSKKVLRIEASCEIIERLGFKPKTFGVRDGLEYMKPCVQVEMENPEKQDTVTEVFVRGWLVESQMMQTFRLCFLVMSKLHSVHFWRTGLTSERISDLASIVSQCEHLKTLTIEANDRIPEENFYELIREESHLTKLQLRFCGITEVGAALLAEQLGNVKSANTKLISLDLSGNRIGDNGAVAIAKALRTNRTLLHLSVSHNGIGNIGGKAFAEVLSRFFLSTEEIFERRILMSEKGGDRAKSVSPPPSRRGDSKDRPGSVKSTDRDKSKNRDKSSKNKKDGKDKDDKGKGKKDDKSNKKASTVGGDAKSTTKTKGKGGKGSKTIAAVEQNEPVSENLENLNPLLEKVETIEPGSLLIPGNFTLILLNFSRNNLSEKAVDEFKTSMAYQVTHIALEQKVNGTGLMKLILKGNKFSEDYSPYKKLEEIMLPRDPFFKAPPKSPDTESQLS